MTPVPAARAVLPAFALISVLALAACAAPAPSPSSVAAETATPTSTPSQSPLPSPAPEGPPPLDQLVVSPDGLGDLLIGDPIQTALATYDPQGCLTQERIDRGVSPDDPRLATWVPNYPTFEGGRGTTRPFVLYPSQGNDPLTHVFVYSPEISTSRSVHVGSTEAEVVAAYPDAPYADGGIGGNSRAYGIEGERGRLVIEVQNPDQESPGGRIVWAIRAETLDRPLGTLAATGAGVFCSLED